MIIMGLALLQYLFKKKKAIKPSVKFRLYYYTICGKIIELIEQVHGGNESL